MDTMTTGTVGHIGVSAPIRKPVKTVQIRFDRGSGHPIFSRNPLRCMALRAGSHSNPSFIDWRIRIHLRLDSMDAMAGGAGGNITSASCDEYAVDAFCKFFGNLGMA